MCIASEAPPGAEVLFDGVDLRGFTARGGGPAGWKVDDGAVRVVAGAGDILSAARFEDALIHPAWRRPNSGHNDPWGMTRHLRTDAPSEPELIVLPDAADDREARYVGGIRTAPPRDYLSHRRLP
ncbi:family 16 glycoside hydrolase [Sorangium sp. So ce1335]|uniref:family 16 glycoside hydrolase n=1 Tax=Sorangium sp. So ce1335 TaxID=3133335 RepID=UPI003F61FE25